MEFYCDHAKNNLPVDYPSPSASNSLTHTAQLFGEPFYLQDITRAYDLWRNLSIVFLNFLNLGNILKYRNSDDITRAPHNKG